MHNLPYYLREALAFFENGLRDGFAHVNGALGLIVALVGAYTLNSWKRLWAVALAATLVHLVAEVMIPVLANQTRFALPSDLLSMTYWRTALALYLGYLLVIALFFVVKKNVLPKAAKASH
jgi:hypothetical protein